VTVTADSEEGGLGGVGSASRRLGPRLGRASGWSVGEALGQIPVNPPIPCALLSLSLSLVSTEHSPGDDDGA
jgi:hypothetical protein